MVPLRLDRMTDPAPVPDHGPAIKAYLNHLRSVSMTCRTLPHATLFEACALLHGSQSATQEAHAEALMRCIHEALGQPARLYAPGTAEMTFDEHWLVQLGLACAREDHASLRFLLHSRVAHENRRLIAFLVARISEHFALT